MKTFLSTYLYHISIMANISLLALPPEVLTSIFMKLNLFELRNLMLTCKSLRNSIINDSKIWRFLCQQRLTMGNSSGNGKLVLLSWYNRCRVSYNWSTGIYKSKILLHHYTNYMPWIKYHNSETLYVSVGSELHCYNTDKKGLPNCKIPLWKLEVPKVKRHDIRTNDISRFVRQDDFLICGNRDGSVAMFQLDCSEQKPSLVCYIKDCHENGEVEVSAVELIIKNDSPPILVTGSSQSSILRLWSTKPEDYINSIFKGTVMDVALSDEKGVKCLDLDFSKKRLAVGLNGNSKPLLVDLTNGRLLMTANETRNAKYAVRDIQWHNENAILYVTYSGRLRMIDTRTQHVVYDMMDPFQSTLYCVKSDGDHAIVVGSSEYSRCVLYDVRNNKKHEQIYFTQKKLSPIYSLDFDSTKLIAAADRSVAVLNFNINVSSTERRDYSYIFEFVKR